MISKDDKSSKRPSLQELVNNSKDNQALVNSDSNGNLKSKSKFHLPLDSLSPTSTADVSKNNACQI